MRSRLCKVVLAASIATPIMARIPSVRPLIPPKILNGPRVSTEAHSKRPHKREATYWQTMFDQVLKNAGLRSFDAKIAYLSKTSEDWKSANENLPLPRFNFSIREPVQHASTMENGNKTGLGSVPQETDYRLNAEFVLPSLGLGFMITSLEQILHNSKHRVDQLELLGKICDGIFEYMAAKADHKVSLDLVAKCRVHVQHARRRLESGSISKISFRELEENLVVAEYKEITSLTSMKSKANALLHYGQIDLAAIDKLSLDDLLATKPDTSYSKHDLPQKLYQENKLRTNKVKSVESAVKAFFPTLKIEGRFYREGDGDPRLDCSATWTIGFNVLGLFRQSVVMARKDGLEYEKVTNKVKADLQFAFNELEMHQKTLLTHLKQYNLRRAIVDLNKAREVTDPDAYYSKAAKYDEEVCKALQKVIQAQLNFLKCYTQIGVLTGKLIPNHSEWTDSIAASIKNKPNSIKGQGYGTTTIKHNSANK